MKKNTDNRTKYSRLSGFAEKERDALGVGNTKRITTQPYIDFKESIFCELKNAKLSPL